MVLPVLIDLKNRKVTVRIPSVDELENDYAIYDDLKDVIKVVGKIHEAEINTAKEISRIFSAKLHDRLLDQNLTISDMRKLFVEAWENESEVAPATLHYAPAIENNTNKTSIMPNVQKIFSVH